MQEAMKKLELAQQMQRMVKSHIVRLKNDIILFSFFFQHTMVDSKFLVTVFVNGKDGQAYTSKVCL